MNGFSVIEAMIAVVILSFGAVAMVQHADFFSLSSQENQRVDAWTSLYGQVRQLLSDPESCGNSLSTFDFTNNDWQPIKIYARNPKKPELQPGQVVSRFLRITEVRARPGARGPANDYVVFVEAAAEKVGRGFTRSDEVELRAGYMVIAQYDGTLRQCTTNNSQLLRNQVVALERRVLNLEAVLTQVHENACPPGTLVAGFTAAMAPICRQIGWVPGSARWAWSAADQASHNAECDPDEAMVSYHINYRGHSPGTGHVAARCAKLELR